MAEIITNADLTAVAGGAVINNEDITVTSNGVYTAGEGYTGLGEVTVNVPLAYPNFSIYGTPERNKYSFSDFSSNDYIFSSPGFAPEQNSWEFGFAFTTATTLQNGVISSATEQFCISANVDAFYVELNAADNTEIISGVTGSSVLEPNTKYYVKFLFDSETHDYKLLYSTDKVNWITERTVNSNLFIKGNALNNFYYGVYANNKAYPFNGIIDMAECYIKIGDTVTWSAIGG